MKRFEIPAVEFVFFNSSSIIATSTPCVCVDCPNCEEGSNDCHCNDSWSSDYAGS